MAEIPWKNRIVSLRAEFAGSLGDLGTLLPIALAMVLFNGIDPVGLFFSVGLYYILAGLYFKVTVPVQPMKMIGAYVIASNIGTQEIHAATLLISVILFFFAVSGATHILARLIPRAIIRGIQFTTGCLLMLSGVKLISGFSQLQSHFMKAEPFLKVETFGPLPIGYLLAACAVVIAYLFRSSRKLPAALLVVGGGVGFGLLFGREQGRIVAELGVHLPRIVSSLPPLAAFEFAFLALVLPQLPMTLGNAVFAYTDLSQKYFGGQSERVTNKAVCLSMALGNLLSFTIGGMPLCHGAGGLAAHYRFGARSLVSNLMIGGLFLLAALLLGRGLISLLQAMPMGVLGVLLVFPGYQLCMMIRDLKKPLEYFLAFFLLVLSLFSNLAVGFLTVLVIVFLLKPTRWRLA